MIDRDPTAPPTRPAQPERAQPERAHPERTRPERQEQDVHETGAIDVAVIGEVLIEISSSAPLADGIATRLGFSGDALNVAAAAAAAGARTALIAKVPADELGDALLARVRELGIDTTWIVRAEGQHGLYLSYADPDGARDFTYLRRGSLGSQLGVADLDPALLASAGIVVASGIACAISETTAEAIRYAAESARRFLYDPNFRSRLTSAAEAAAVLRELAPLAFVITPSWPTETARLLGLPPDTPPKQALAALTRLGARNVVMTCGPDGARVATSDGTRHHVPSLRAPLVVDQTGAGDCFAGTLAARIALGDPILVAVRLAAAAAALSVQGQGGTGHVPSLAETLAALEPPTPTQPTPQPDAAPASSEVER
jgi:2-dehydro-3-deoxygluconokinase